MSRMDPVTRPPAHVPTLTDIVHADKAAGPDMREQMVQRVLQHVSLSLEKRLQDATERLVRKHTDALLPQLRDEIERVVRESVHEAFEREKAAMRVPAGSAKSGT